MKKLFALIFAVTMLFAIAVPTAALTMTNDTYDPETGEVIPGHVVIDNPYAVLWSEFFIDGEYPDDFAGIWVDYDENGVEFYTFALVDGTDSSKYEAVLGDYAGQYRFEYMRYSYNFLKSIKDDIEKELDEEVKVWGWGIDESENTIHYEAESADEAAYEALYRAIDKVAEAHGIEIPYDVAVLEESGPIVPVNGVDLAYEDDIEGNPTTGAAFAVFPLVAASAALAARKFRR